MMTGQELPGGDVEQVQTWLTRFGLSEGLGSHVECVLTQLPEAVRSDLLEDPCFTMCEYEPGQGGVEVPLKVPASRNGSRGPSRCVALKRSLVRRPAGFVRWVIAHELAHAHLRNGGRWPGEDPELAADALAAEWGFPRPA
jgi:hypothetical protein